MKKNNLLHELQNTFQAILLQLEFQHKEDCALKTPKNIDLRPIFYKQLFLSYFCLNLQFPPSLYLNTKIISFLIGHDLFNNQTLQSFKIKACDLAPLLLYLWEDECDRCVHAFFVKNINKLQVLEILIYSKLKLENKKFIMDLYYNAFKSDMIAA